MNIIAKCILCKGKLMRYGHNPEPLSEKGRCCNTCNDIKVIPARISQARKIMLRNQK